MSQVAVLLRISQPWVPTQEESCKFVPIAKMKGHLLGDVWISDYKKFALSWSDNSPRIQDCKVDLVMSDQGYALMTTSRVPRAATPKERLSQFRSHLSTPAADSQHPASSFSFWSFLLSSWSCFDVWVSIYCVVISLRILRTVIAVYCSMYFPGGLPSPTDLILSSRRSLAPSSPGSPPPLALTAPQPSSREDIDRRQMDDLTFQLTRLEIDSTSTWPPRVSVTPVKVLALMNHKQFLVAQIPIKVNNIHVLALIDTGASITVTTVETAPLFGVFTFSAGNISTAIGMAGIPIRILGCATLHFEFGSVAIDHPVYFTEAACVSSSADSYNIILGNDLLAKLPPWLINYANRTFSMAEHNMLILCVAPPSNECSSEEPIAVRVLETTVSLLLQRLSFVVGLILRTNTPSCSLPKLVVYVKDP
ncbi:unnamed protein product [Heligmosomoides polygyrus]|uniref:Peptidase A2 domain-containing protein n=1 Tax=Heligmosomoides polygyrus TaxID=6339 RepID=A0A183G726_HELPZ|nr:unnamed protein product [Heligmosomoides polygyrus]